MINDHKANIDGLDIHYRITGDIGKQHLVFLHGWAARLDGPLGSDKVILELSKYFYVIAPEHPGLVRSSPPKEIWGLDDYAHALNKLLKPLNLVRPIIMGQSFGGGVATAYAKLYPEEIKLLILVDSITSNRPYNFYQKLKYLWCPLFAFIIKSRWTPLFFKKIWITIALGVPIKMISSSNARDYSIMGEIPTGKNYTLNIDYKTLRMPLLLVWGNRDTWVTPIECAKEIHCEVKNSKLLIFEGPHTVLYQKPKIVIGGILKSLPQNL